MLYSLEKMLNCTVCKLHKTRTNVVPGRGDPSASLWFAGEAPGRKEDETGQAFVGRAGRLLDRCLEKECITYFNIVNILKCRPPDNRDPTELEMQVCTNTWLYAQINEHNPHVIVAMGRYSIGFFRQYVWKDIRKMRVTDEVMRLPTKTPAGRIVIATYHPAYLLRNADAVMYFLSQLRLAKKLQAQWEHENTRSI